MGAGATRGLTLIELVVAIVVIAIATSGVLAVMNYTTTHSADPLLEHQATAIAEAYLEEILLKPFVDPDGVEPEASRDLFDDVDDFNALPDTVVRDQDGTAIAGLGSYAVTVTVAGEALGGIAAANCQKVRVRVTHPAGVDIALVGYRTNY